MSAIDFSQNADDVVNISEDLNYSVDGEGFAPPEAGPAMLRFIRYIEVGKETKEGTNDKGVAVMRSYDRAWLYFELVSKKHAPIVSSDGRLFPHVLRVKLNKSMSSRGSYTKVFKQMNFVLGPDGKKVQGPAKHFIQLLGKGYTGTVQHVKGEANEQGKTRIWGTLKDKIGNVFVNAPFSQDADDEGNLIDKPVSIPVGVEKQMCFNWNGPETRFEQFWDSIYIPTPPAGEDGVAPKSRNIFQDEIRAAENFEGSPIDLWLKARKGPQAPSQGGSTAPAKKVAKKAPVAPPSTLPDTETELPDDDLSDI